MISQYMKYIKECEELVKYGEKHFEGISGVDFNCILELLHKIKDCKSIGIYGTGSHSERLIKILLHYGFGKNIKCFIDEYSNDDIFYSYDLVTNVYNACEKYDLEVIIISSKLFEDQIFERISSKVKKGTSLFRIYEDRWKAEERAYFFEDETKSIRKKIFCWNSYYTHINRYAFAKSFVNNKVVLDMACGSGYGTQILAERAKKVYGVDLASDAIEFAQKHHIEDNIQFCNSSIEKFNLKENKADIVVSFETIEHIEDTDLYFKCVINNVKENGICIISTPVVMNNGQSKTNPYHVNEFTIERFKEELNKYFISVDWYCQRNDFGGGIFVDDGSFSQTGNAGAYAIAVCYGLK